MHGCKTCLGKFQKIKKVSSIFSNTMRLEIHYMGKKQQLQKQGHMEAKQHATKTASGLLKKPKRKLKITYGQK